MIQFFLLLLINFTVGNICVGDRIYNTAVSGGCTNITGNLFLHEIIEDNLDALSNLTSISGYLYIGDSDNLENVDGLTNLVYIGGCLAIYNNSVLDNIDGLIGISSMSGSITISENGNLENIDGLSSLTSIGGDLSISYNSILENIDGLLVLTSVEGSIRIEYNTVLSQMEGLKNIEIIKGLLIFAPLPIPFCSIELKNMVLNVEDYELDCTGLLEIITMVNVSSMNEMTTMNEFSSEEIPDPTNICDFIQCDDPIIQDIQYNDTIQVKDISLTIGGSTSFSNGLKLTNSTLVIKSSFIVTNRCLEISDNVHVDIDLEKANSRENNTIIRYSCRMGEFDSFSVPNGDSSCKPNLDYTENQLTLFYTDCFDWWIILVVIGSILLVLVVLTLVILFNPTVRNMLLPYRDRN